MTSVREVLDLLNGIAPLDLAEEWDNVGLLVGNPDAQVERALCTLDLSAGAIARAKEIGAGLIVTHHPVMFRGRKNLREDDPEGRLLCGLIREGIALIAMHTNYDIAHPGVNDALALAFGLRDVRPFPCGMCAGDLKEEKTLSEFAAQTELVLCDAVRVYGDCGKTIRRVAVMGGSGADYVSVALDAGADAFVTGEIGYHRALDAVDRGLLILEAGHAATEKPAIPMLAEALQNAADAVQYKIYVDSF